MPWRHDLISRFGLNDSQSAAFDLLLSLLVEQKDRQLTAVKSPENIVKVHFLDSLSLLKLPELAQGMSAVDIGSGAGFPGLPLAIARPDLMISLVESNQKKSAFLSDAIERLDLKNASVWPARAEEAGRSELRESFDVALARAVGSLPEVLEYSFPLLKQGGHALLQRGAREPGDEQLAQGAAKELGGLLVRIEKAAPYPSAKNLHIWVFKKTSPTPAKYPRRPGMARKRPLGKSSF